MDGGDSRDGEASLRTTPGRGAARSGPWGSRRGGLGILLTQHTRRGIARMQLPEWGAPTLLFT